uniref:Uncharacterized protein n=1 Tax=Orbilia oligospora TaxID=2813651 RepID=A0A6G6A4Q2_ORBOL|nr:hypothetical protein [Orbilia oligospora]QID02814.1 hypothetical protein [Orbilia oligospora]
MLYSIFFSISPFSELIFFLNNQYQCLPIIFCVLFKSLFNSFVYSEFKSLEFITSKKITSLQLWKGAQLVSSFKEYSWLLDKGKLLLEDNKLSLEEDDKLSLSLYSKAFIFPLLLITSEKSLSSQLWKGAQLVSSFNKITLLEKILFLISKY